MEILFRFTPQTAILAFFALTAHAATINVSPGAGLPAAIAAALTGDTVQ